MESNKQVTAVEWLEEEIFRRYKFAFQQLNCNSLEEAIEQAKEMENEQRGYSKEKVDKLLDRLLYNNMCSHAGDELIEQFKTK